MIDIKENGKFKIDIYLKITSGEDKTPYEIVQEHIKVTNINPKGYTWWGNNQPFTPEKLNKFIEYGHDPHALMVIPHTSGGNDNVAFVADILDAVKSAEGCFPPDDWRPKYYFNSPSKVWLKLSNFRTVAPEDAITINDYYLISNDEPLVDKIPTQYACGYVYKLKTDHNCLNNQSTISEIESDDIGETEKNSIVKLRIGQGIFKKSLLKRENSCKLCGLNCEMLLIASHIKPWRDSNNNERLDENNGFLLCPQHDAVFDKGLITFSDEGELIISHLLNDKDYSLLNIGENIKIKMNNQQKKFVKWHRDNIFKG